ncbi:MAG: carbamate kinase [Eubacteriales bacterium]|nr:carbamate kinase [Eubacteriales bacterium]
MKKRMVVALGHRALGTTLPAQKKAVKQSAAVLADLVEEGYQLAICHSNAPQVGMIHTAMNEFGKAHPDYTVAPMSVCSAMSQGYIGYDLQNAMRAELLKRGISKTASTILTQVLVDPYDDAFYHPVKVIGRYMTAEEADAEERKGNSVIEEPGKGFRRIVSAPRPKDIIEIDAIRTLLDADQVVIACGGGGIPVLAQGVELKGASAIIEKDYISGKLAEMVDADTLLILTTEPHLHLHYNTDRQEAIRAITVSQAEEYIADNQFPKASKLPKVQASVDFVKGKEGRTAIITDLEHAKAALAGKDGTIITA